MTFVIKDPNQPSDRPVEASLELESNGHLCLMLNGQKVLSVSPNSGRLLLTEKIPEAQLPNLALDSRGAILLCPQDIDFYKRS